MAEIYQLPDNGGNNNGVSGIPFSIPIGGFGGNGLFGGNGNGFNSIADLFGLANKAFLSDFQSLNVQLLILTKR